MFRLAFWTSCAAFAGFVLSTGAKADAIYGCWTNGSETLTVEHTRVVTSTGQSPDAAIDRHSAEFVSPEGERDAGQRSGLTSAEKDRIRDLERENRELRTANEILKKASAYFAMAELDRPFRK